MTPSPATWMNRAGKIRRLVVGGGHAPGFPPSKAEDVSLNVDAEAMPDVVGDIAHAPLASGIFDEVYFEKVPFGAFTGGNSIALREAARVLCPGGRVVIEPGWAAPVPEIRAAMREAGFRYVRSKNIFAKGAAVGEIRKSFLRFTGRLSLR